MGPYWIMPPSTPASSRANLALSPSFSLRSSHSRRLGPASLASSDQSSRQRQKQVFSVLGEVDYPHGAPPGGRRCRTAVLYSGRLVGR